MGDLFFAETLNSKSFLFEPNVAQAQVPGRSATRRMTNVSFEHYLVVNRFTTGNRSRRSGPAQLKSTHKFRRIPPLCT